MIWWSLVLSDLNLLIGKKIEMEIAVRCKSTHSAKGSILTSDPRITIMSLLGMMLIGL